ncbi:MAG: hypothetical protein OEM18_04245 [Nitrosopumilus sp.]|nr:hypothetical protein [Nitrosopumilus sp.]MDH3501802.1 hypothetical protein [Nitrosopumilus sp.]
MVCAVVYCTANQENRILDNVILASAVEQGEFTPKSGLGPN